MAEQVVDIRQRIERMRTQIDDSESPRNDLPKFVEKKDNKIIKSETDKQSIIEKKDLGDNFLKRADNSEANTEEKPKIKSINPDNTDKKYNPEHLQSQSNRQNKIKDTTDHVESKKSFENYQFKNTVDSQNKKVEFDNVAEKFPQFSLNINNPISWKLMLLIMLMQLLTNIMLVVVLYLK